MWGDQVDRVPTNDRWPISVTSHHLALTCTTWPPMTKPNGINCVHASTPNPGALFRAPAEHAGVLSLQAVVKGQDGAASQYITDSVLSIRRLGRVWGSLPSRDSHMQNSSPPSQSPSAPASVSV